MAVITVGTMQLATVSMQSSQVVRGTFSEQELRIAVNNILTNDNYCKANLKPEAGRLTGSNSQKGIGTISKLEQDGVALLEEGKSFKGNLDIVKLELTGDATQNPKTATVNRKFVVYYSKKQTKDLNTLDGGDCTSSDTSGCYFLECDLDYRLENVASNPDVVACDTLNCVGGDNISCYTVDMEEPSLSSTISPAGIRVSVLYTSDPSLTALTHYYLDAANIEGKGRTLVGCGGTSKIKASTTTAFGFESGINTETIVGGAGVFNDGTANSFFGYQAGYSNTRGSKNVFFGFKAGYKNTIGSNNHFIGESAGFNNTTGGANVFVGRRAGYFSNSSNNVFLGNRAGMGNVSGEDSNYIGRRAGYFSKEGNYNNFLGYEAGYTNNAVDTSIPVIASHPIPGLPVPVLDSSNNNFLGYQAGRSNTSGSYNTFIGYQAGLYNTTGLANIFIGDIAGRANTTGRANVFLGRGAGLKNTTGQDNVFLGNRAGMSNVSGKSSNYIGRRAGYFSKEGNYNNFLGYEAGYTNNAVDTSIPVIASHPIPGLPVPVLDSSNNSFLGYQAGRSNTSGSYNTFIGYQAGLYNTTGLANIFIGDIAGRANTTGRANVFLGRGAGFKNTTGQDNVFIGNRAGRYSTVGNDNVYLGRRAGGNSTTGNNNVFLGYEAGFSNTTGNTNLFLGYQVKSGPGISATADSQLNIGNLILGKLNTSAPSSGPSIPSTPGAVIHGTLDVAKKLTVHTGGLEVSGGINLSSGVFSCGGSICPSMPGHTHPYSPSGHSHGTSSSRVYKKNIKKFKNFERAYKDIKKTPLFTYEYKEDHPNKSRMGFISEELPNYLQIIDKGQPSMPDMPSIYGTFWASIKALIIKFEGFKENTLSALKKVTEEVIAIKENTSSAIKKLTDKIEATNSQIYEMKTGIVDKLQVLDSKIQEKIKAIIKEIEEIKTAWAKEKEEISKLNTLILLQQETLTSQQEALTSQQKALTSQQKALTSQQKELTELKTKLKDIEKAQQKADREGTLK